MNAALKPNDPVAFSRIYICWGGLALKKKNAMGIYPPMQYVHAKITLPRVTLRGILLLMRDCTTGKKYTYTCGSTIIILRCSVNTILLINTFSSVLNNNNNNNDSTYYIAR